MTSTSTTKHRTNRTFLKSVGALSHVCSFLALVSTRNPAKATYAIGVTHNGSIYLTPVMVNFGNDA